MLSFFACNKDRATNVDVEGYVLQSLDDFNIVIDGEDVVLRSIKNWQDKERITKVIIPNGVTVIGGYVFSNCNSLTEIVISNTVVEICDRAFADCNALQDLILPNSLKTIDGSMISGCTNLFSITIPENVEQINGFPLGERLVEICNKSSINLMIPYDIQQDIRCPLRIYSEGESFLSTDENGFVVYNDGTNAVLICYQWNSSSVKIPNQITRIHQSAFKNRSDIKDVSLPSSLESIGAKAFYNTELTDIYFDGTLEQWNCIEKDNEWIYQNEQTI